MDLGLKATILCIGRNKQNKLCQQHPRNRTSGIYQPPLGFKFDTPKVKVVLNMSNKEAKIWTLSCFTGKLLESSVSQLALQWAGVYRGKVQRILILINDPRNRWFITDLPYTSSNVSCQVINYTD